jgi:hypothetical protein
MKYRRRGRVVTPCPSEWKGSYTYKCPPHTLGNFSEFFTSIKKSPSLKEGKHCCHHKAVHDMNHYSSTQHNTSLNENKHPETTWLEGKTNMNHNNKTTAPEKTGKKIPSNGRYSLRYIAVFIYARWDTLRLPFHLFSHIGKYFPIHSFQSPQTAALKNLKLNTWSKYTSTPRTYLCRELLNLPQNNSTSISQSQKLAERAINLAHQAKDPIMNKHSIVKGIGWEGWSHRVLSKT